MQPVAVLPLPVTAKIIGESSFGICFYFILVPIFLRWE